MKKISVIVAIYNSEKYLKKCLDSIANQEYQNLEVILVNDGSTDNSGLIAKEYEGKYPNVFKYYEKQNSGVSDTRNFGVQKSTGEYITFVDSDDFTTSNLYKDLDIKAVKYLLVYLLI